MKLQNSKKISSFFLIGTILSQCTMMKDVTYSVTPSPLEMHNDSIIVKISGTIPKKGLRKKVSCELTPMLGNSALNSVSIIGQKATGNGTTIQFKPGGQFNYEDKIQYKPEFENSDLTITGRVMKGGVEKLVLPAKKIAEGTVVTPLLFEKDFKVSSLYDTNHQSVTTHTYASKIRFPKAKSEIIPSELNGKDIKNLIKWISDASVNPKIKITMVDVVAYASPEGEENSNNTLSTDRATVTKSKLLELFKKASVVSISESTINNKGNGEDFEGLKIEMERSAMNEDDRRLVIRVLEMYKDPIQREQEIKNMSKTFTYLETTIFPILRRSEIVVSYEMTAYSNEEYALLSIKSPEKLSVDELLYATKLHKNDKDIVSVLKAADSLFPLDHRASNNLGVMCFNNNNLIDAEAFFVKSNSIKSNITSTSNLGAVYGIKKDFAKASELFSKSNSPEARYNKGILQIKEGKYSDAVANFSEYKTYNKALAQLLAMEYESALTTLSESNESSSVKGSYLRAIIYTRIDKFDDACGQLKIVFDGDPSFKAIAKKDKEFLKLIENPIFIELVK